MLAAWVLPQQCCRAVSSDTISGSYDHKLGTSERGTVPADDAKFKIPPFKKMIVVFGEVHSLEDIVENGSELSMSAKEAYPIIQLNIWVNTSLRKDRAQSAPSFANFVGAAHDTS